MHAQGTKTVLREEIARGLKKNCCLAQPICSSLIKVVRCQEDNTTPRWTLIGHLDPESRELGEGAVYRIGEEIEKRKGGKKDWGERLQVYDFLSLLVACQNRTEIASQTQVAD